ncbi:two component transcriptional regulator, LuxR family [Beutenbergia cavernae DSM 12333]|uniref:Two component transcriptional regulator, LuxR family n=1 Tax=Beutenbergia cavernae (strain ATCC BAA-8 / DSM 12333 / CCUG 43141 / JCM 11478 / NBRC 16432 / NCIMB 13614 / HKI 0122) TaxID=471853 RepID=C5BXQ1_BEUC1|nr:two component transcriptional regulator, LuxR family [Beutenbergia cavernae DSM 12333]
MTRVLLVDDDPLVRAGLRLMLESAGDLDVVGEVGDGAEVVDAVARWAPDVVLMDIRMPVLDGIAATRALVDRPGATPAVLVLTTFGADRTVVDALRAGAAGYVLKDTPPAEIVEAVRRVAAGEAVLSPAVTRSLIDVATAADSEPEAGAAARRSLAALTERERDVADAVADGLSNGEIAARLYLSTSSVKTHLSSALTKLGLVNRVQLAILAHASRRPDAEGR